MTSTASSPKLNKELHVKYIQNLSVAQDLPFHLSTHLRLNGIYWGLTALWMMGRQDALPKQEMVDWVMSCHDKKTGAFGASPKHDPHSHSTLSAIQILVMQDSLHLLDVDQTAKWILTLQNPTTGSFAGDQWGEVDTRFTYTAVQALSLLGKLHLLNKELTISHLRTCKNFDGGFGSNTGAESHAAQVCTSVCTLAILDALDEVDVPALTWWLAERQLPNGGLNGRPEKLEDVCYSWWDLSAMSILGKLEWINAEALASFILSAQDLEEGGIADRPGDMVDVFHTIFGIAGLSLTGYPGLEDIDPVYCLPASITERMGLRKSSWVALPRRTDE